MLLRHWPPLLFIRLAAPVLLLVLMSVQPVCADIIKYSGRSYVGLDTVSSRLGMERKWLVAGSKLSLGSKWTQIEFEQHKRAITLNGVNVHLGFSVIRRGNMLYISESDYEKTLQPLLTPQVFPPPGKLAKIVLDAGHGGKDDGAQNKDLKLKEKNLALDLTKRLKVILEKRGYQVELTRSGDSFIELNDRAAIANRLDADLFISLHFNATSHSSVSGVETYVLTPSGQPSTSGTTPVSEVHPGNRYDAWSTLAGYYIQREMVNQLKSNDRGLKRARFAVLRPLNCPGVLVEAGFVSNNREGANIGWDAYRQRIAESLADAVDAYQKTLNRASVN